MPTRRSILNRIRGLPRMLSTVVAGLLLTAAPAAWAGGKLVIVGGALDANNDAVHSAFVEAILAEGPVVIIPAASGQPARSAARFAEQLVRYGVDAERVEIFPLAVRDDSETTDVDESTWSSNAWKPELVQQVEAAAGVWFTGGDQVRILQTLTSEEGEESPLLLSIRKQLANGAVVGGSSAGAAVMSRDMIAGGISFTALLEPLTSQYASTEAQDSGRLFLSRGLGFLPEGIVDQHFDRKARLGRLVRALAATGQRRGYGVDEDTALIVDLGLAEGRVAGRGSVTLLDAGQARFQFSGKELARALEINVLAAGTRFRLADFTLIDGQGDATRGREYYGYEPVQGGGMAFANPRLDQALGHDLLDNSASTVLHRYSIDADGRVLIYTFSETAASQGYWQREGSGERYTASRVRFDISRSDAVLSGTSAKPGVKTQ